MYSYNFTKEKLNKIETLLNDNSACFHEKTEAIVSIIKQKHIKNQIILKYINLYLDSINLEKIMNNNDVFYELAKHKRTVILKNMLNKEKINKLIHKNLCLYYACKHNQTKNIDMLLKEGVIIEIEHLEFILDNKNFDAFNLFLEKTSNIINNEKEVIKTVLRKKWYTAINKLIETEKWMCKIDNEILKEFKNDKLLTPFIKKLELSLMKNKLEVF